MASGIVIQLGPTG